MGKKIKDIKQLAKWMESIPDTAMDDFNDLVKAYTLKVKNDATKNAPYDTGYLAGSINYRFMQNGKYVEGVVYVGAEYGWYVEFGTSNHYAQPFFYPAFNKYYDRFLNALYKAMEESMK